MLKDTVLLTGCLVLASWTAAAATVTTGTLIDEMVDMQGLAQMPSPYHKTVQFSSYDRNSALPNGPGWFDNSDGFGKEKTPNFEGVVSGPNDRGIGEYLICDVEGPGAIVRTWTARIGGKIQVYLDGDPEAIYDGTAGYFFMNPYLAIAGKREMDKDALNMGFQQRNAGYAPIPFAKRCRVVWKGDVSGAHFYEIEVRRYERGTTVQTFGKEDLEEYAKNIERAGKIMADPERNLGVTPESTKEVIDATVKPNENMRALSLSGPGAIEKLVLNVKADNLTLALRQTIMHIRFDSYPWGQVQAPVGDFFGAAPGINPYSSLPFTVEADGTMTCRFVMPFAKQADIHFENLGEQVVRVHGEVLKAGYDWNDASMYFRARWRIDHDLVASTTVVQDIPFLIASGAGRYVGTAAYILNASNIPAIGGSWWGEGDEKIFVDDDIQPSFFGTGSEDYFNYAWSSNEIFAHPYGGQARNDGPANRGFITNTRWHILDSLLFKHRLSFYMELFTHDLTHGMAYARIGYHYGAPFVMDDHLVITREDVRKQLPPQQWTPKGTQAARNSTFWEPETQIVGATKTRVAAHEMATGSGVFEWTPEGEGDTITFTIPVPKEGKYRLRAVTLQDPDSGKVQFSLNGRIEDMNKGKVADLHRPFRTQLRAVDSGLLDLPAGDHSLTLTFKGGKKKIGIDFLWLQAR